MVLKTFLALLAVSAAAAAIVVRAAPLPEGGRPQEAGLRLDPVTLTDPERTEVLEGKVVLRSVPNPGLKGRTFEAIGTVPGTLDEVLAVLCDYRRYDEFMPRVERTAVTDEGPAAALVEQHLKLPMGLRRRCRLRYTARVGSEGFRVEWVQVPWPEVPPRQTIAETSGYWQVAPDACGALLAVYHVYTDPGHVPLGMKGLALSFSKHDLRKILEAVRDRLRPRAARAPRAAPAPARPQSSAP
jgi:hypothetical protein